MDAIEERLINAVLTNHTCGEGCWYAREKVCRCSCGGKHHGCLLDGGTARPVRTSRIDGLTYELVAVGMYADLYRQAENACIVAGVHKVIGPFKYYWSPTEKGSPIRLKKASGAQMGSWKELAGCDSRTYLLWRFVQGVDAHSEWTLGPLPENS